MDNFFNDSNSNRKSKYKILVLVTVVLSILLVTVIGYICYDKLLFKDENVNSNKSSDDVSKVDDTVLDKLYNSLITYDGSYGFYFDRDVNIDNITAEEMIKFVIIEYAKENNFSFKNNLQCVTGVINEGDTDWDKICNNVTDEIASKDKIDQFINKLFNSEREFVLKSNFGDNLYSIKLNDCAGFVYDLDKEIFYFGTFASECGETSVYRNKIKIEQNNNYIYIYDTFFAVSRFSGWVDGYADLSNTKEIFSYFLNDVFPSYITNDSVDSTYVFENYKDRLNVYKHTFELADDMNYYWVSSEIISQFYNAV